MLEWTKTRSQEIVGCDYVKREIRKRLASYSLFKQLAPGPRASVLETVTSPAWLRRTNGQAVGAVVRGAKDVAMLAWAQSVEVSR